MNFDFSKLNEQAQVIANMTPHNPVNDTNDMLELLIDKLDQSSVEQTKNNRRTIIIAVTTLVVAIATLIATVIGIVL